MLLEVSQGIIDLIETPGKLESLGVPHLLDEGIGGQLVSFGLDFLEVFLEESGDLFSETSLIIAEEVLLDHLEELLSEPFFSENPLEVLDVQSVFDFRVVQRVVVQHDVHLVLLRLLEEVVVEELLLRAFLVLQVLRLVVVVLQDLHYSLEHEFVVLFRPLLGVQFADGLYLVLDLGLVHLV